MRIRGCLLLLFVVGCVPFQLVPDEPPTQQVASNPFAVPRKAMPMRLNLPPATQEVVYRVELVRGKIVGDNMEKTGLRPNVVTLGAADPEIFHVGIGLIYITEGLVRQCQTDGQLAAVLANEMGRMVAERESAVSDSIRNPDRLPPIFLPISANGYSAHADPTYEIQLARFEKQFPRQGKKLAGPNPQQVARAMLERAGYERTELDAAMPLLQDAGRNSLLEDQLKGTLKQNDWTTP